MGPKPQKSQLTSGSHLTNNAGGEALRRSNHSTWGTGGALRQKELIESIQTTPCELQNAEMR
jgi:hypothetical protein